MATTPPSPRNGEWVRMRQRGIEQRDLLTEHLAGVRDVETAPVVRTVKRGGALLPR